MNDKELYVRNNELYAAGKAMKTRGIVGIVLIFTLIGILVTGIMALIDAIKILATRWNNKELDDQKILWGLLTLLVIGPIGEIVFGVKMMQEAEKPVFDPTQMNKPF